MIKRIKQTSPGKSRPSSFRFGETVEFGQNSKLPFEVIDHETSEIITVSFPAGRMGYGLGTYRSDSPDGNYIIISTTATNPNSVPKIIRAPRHLVQSFQFGTKDAFNQAISPLLSLPLIFEEGERVRYRNSQGILKSGFFAGAVGSYFEIKDGVSREIYLVDFVKVAKFNLFDPVNVDIPLHTTHEEFDRFAPAFTDFLNAGMRLGSLPDSMQKSPLELVKMYLNFVLTTMPYVRGASFAYESNISRVSELICLGGGVCRHQAAVLYLLLSEAGFEVRYNQQTWSAGGAGGHAWLEVDMVDPLTSGATAYVVDPAMKILGSVKALKMKGDQWIEEHPEAINWTESEWENFFNTSSAAHPSLSFYSWPRRFNKSFRAEPVTEALF